MWPGADLQRIGSSHEYFFRASEDKLISLKKGFRAYRRFLTTRKNLVFGDWKVRAALWFGPRSKPQNSICLGLNESSAFITFGLDSPDAAL
jgi:hypothetical protein